MWATVLSQLSLWNISLQTQRSLLSALHKISVSSVSFISLCTLGGSPHCSDNRADQSLRFRPHKQKQCFFPPSSSASSQEYLRPDGSTENDRKHCSSYSRPIDGAWHSPKTEKKRWRMGARKPESFVWTVNEVELLLQHTLNYKWVLKVSE